MNKKTKHPQNTDGDQEYYIKFRLSVKDYGIGIPIEKQASLFVNFSKIGDSSLNKNGVGLGLSICKNLIEKMGGTIRLESS